MDTEAEIKESLRIKETDKEAVKRIDKTAIFVDDPFNNHRGTRIFMNNWNGTHSIALSDEIALYHSHYIDVTYDYEIREGFYFFKRDAHEGYVALTEAGAKYLLFGRLNHEQKEAKRLLEFLNLSFEDLNIKTRYGLSELFHAALLHKKFGKVKFKRNVYEGIEAKIYTKKGIFECIARFDGFERSLILDEIAYNL